MNSNAKETVEEAVARMMSKAKVDIDIEYCKKHGIKFKNHEVDAARVDLFNSESNKAAFDYVFKNR